MVSVTEEVVPSYAALSYAWGRASDEAKLQECDSSGALKSPKTRISPGSRQGTVQEHELPDHVNDPLLRVGPRRSRTTFKDVVDAHKRRVKITLQGMTRKRAAVEHSSPITRKYVSKGRRGPPMPIPHSQLPKALTLYQDYLSKAKEAQSPSKTQADSITHVPLVLSSDDGSKVNQGVRRPLSPVSMAQRSLIRHLGPCSTCRSRRVAVSFS